MKNKNRVSGYYWVHILESGWHIGYYRPSKGFVVDGNSNYRSDYYFDAIDERKIINPNENMQQETKRLENK